MTYEIVAEPINGSELIGPLDAPYNALVQFYKAFNKGDFDLMAHNWLQTPDAAMSNPLGDVKRGWTEIASIYENIFNGPADVYVEYFDYAIYHGSDFFQAVGRERGSFSIGGKTIDLRIRTSRTYVLQEDGFKQLHHHGSIDEPDLLAAYQSGVRHGVIA